MNSYCEDYVIKPSRAINPKVGYVEREGGRERERGGRRK